MYIPPGVCQSRIRVGGAALITLFPILCQTPVFAAPPAPPAPILASQMGYSAPPPAPGYIGPQPSLGYGVSPIRGIWGPHFAPFAEARLRLEDRPARGFGEMLTLDAADIAARLRMGALWFDGSNTALIQGQGAATGPLEKSANVSNKHIEFHQLFYTRSRIAGSGSARIGRQELSYGNERMVGPANFSQPGRTWDGIRLAYGKPGRTLDAFYTHTVNFQTPQAMFYFSGLWGVWTDPRAGEFNLYGLHKGNDAGTALHRNTFGGLWRYHATTDISTELQLNGQLGSEAGKNVGAWSGRFVAAERVDTRIKLLHNLTFYEEGEYATGSGATSGDAGTFDQLFPTTHGKWGQLDYQGWRNMTEVRVGTSFEPKPKFLAGLDYYNFGLASPHDFWYRSNGSAFFTAAMQDRKKDYGVHTGQEFDASLTWKVNPRINWQGALGEFFPGDFVKNVTGKSDPSTLVYLQGTYTF